jgi:Icc protein
MITSPADERLVIDPFSPVQVVRGQIQVRARAWGNAIQEVTMSIDHGSAAPMKALGESIWSAIGNLEPFANGSHLLAVTAKITDGRSATDTLTVLVNQQGKYDPPVRNDVGHTNALGEWPEKHIPGTQLGPNENGHPWSSRRERERVTR